MKRRNLDLKSAQEIVDEIQLLQDQGYVQTGNWNLTQICEHLTATMKGGMEGFGFRLPWVLRATVLKWSFKHILKTRKLNSGFPTFSVLKPKHSGLEDDQPTIVLCMETCLRASAFPGPMTDYALVDDLSVQDWRDFMWIHASHHLSFLIPNEQIPNEQADEVASEPVALSDDRSGL